MICTPIGNPLPVGPGRNRQRRSPHETRRHQVDERFAVHTAGDLRAQRCGVAGGRRDHQVDGGRRAQVAVDVAVPVLQLQHHVRAGQARLPAGARPVPVGHVPGRGEPVDVPPDLDRTGGDERGAGPQDGVPDVRRRLPRPVSRGDGDPQPPQRHRRRRSQRDRSGGRVQPVRAGQHGQRLLERRRPSRRAGRSACARRCAGRPGGSGRWSGPAPRSGAARTPRPTPRAAGCCPRSRCRCPAPRHPPRRPRPRHCWIRPPSAWDRPGAPRRPTAASSPRRPRRRRAAGPRRSRPAPDAARGRSSRPRTGSPRRRSSP